MIPTEIASDIEVFLNHHIIGKARRLTFRLFDLAMCFSLVHIFTVSPFHLFRCSLSSLIDVCERHNIECKNDDFRIV